MKHHRSCCFGFITFFDNANKAASSSAAYSIGEIASESGEKLLHTINRASSEYQKRKQTFFSEIDRFAIGGEEKLSSSRDRVYGCKK